MTASWIRTMLTKIDQHKMKNVLKTKEHLWFNSNKNKMRICWYLKKRYFPVSFGKLLRAPCFIEHLWWLLTSASSQFCIFNDTALKVYRRLQ